MTAMIDIPGASALPGLVFRHFAGEGDFAAMAAVLNASFAADRIEIVRSAADLARDYASMVNCDPRQDVVIAQVDGRMVGYGRGGWWTQADGLTLHGLYGFVAPAWRRKGIGRALLAWLEQRQRAVAAALPAGAGHQLHVFVTETEQARAALLRSAGYTVARHFFTMVRAGLQTRPIADGPLPPGLELRPVLPQHYRAIWEAHGRAFANNWGHVPPREGDYEAWLADKALFQPQLWQVAWDSATGQVAGQVRASLSEHNRQFNRARGRTDFIGVDPAWRRRGLARALILASLRAQREAGMAESALEVDSANADGATRVYQACGFEVVKRNAAWRKPV